MFSQNKDGKHSVRVPKLFIKKQRQLSYKASKHK